MQKGPCVFWCLMILAGNALGQATNASLNEDYYHAIDRYEIKAGRVVPALFTTLKPYKRNAIIAYIDSLDTADGVFTSPADRFNYDYSDDELRGFVLPIRNLREQAREVHVIFNNNLEDQGVRNARSMLRLLAETF